MHQYSWKILISLLSVLQRFEIVTKCTHGTHYLDKADLHKNKILCKYTLMSISTRPDTISSHCYSYFVTIILYDWLEAGSTSSLRYDRSSHYGGHFHTALAKVLLLPSAAVYSIKNDMLSCHVLSFTQEHSKIQC